jgi:pimeloyl-ACP methyl ester carboxylesterase
VLTAIRDGVALRYRRADGDLVPIVLVHGWCCDHSYFAPQFEHFAGRGHTVVAVDLRGHGESDQPEQAYSMQVFADDLAWLADDLGLGHPVFVGHSMGGVAAFDLAVRHPWLPAGVVMIDSPVVRPEASRARMPAFLERLRGPDYRTAIADYVEQVLFLPTDDPRRKADVLARMPETARHVMVAALEGLRDFDPEEAAGRVLAPSLYIAADDRPLSDMPRFFALAPDMLFGQTVGSGHFCQLEVPEQVNAMIERFLAILPSLRNG